MTAWPRTAHRHITRTLPAVLGVLGVLLIGQGITASPARAHNALIRTVPADGATVERVPGLVRLVFDQPAMALGTEVLITGPAGRVERGTPQLVDTDVRQGIGPDAPAGRYVVTWRVTSVDGHPVSGQFSFTARSAGGGPATRQTDAPAPGSATTTKQTQTGPATPVLLLAAALVLAAGVLAARRLRRH